MRGEYCLNSNVIALDITVIVDGVCIICTLALPSLPTLYILYIVLIIIVIIIIIVITILIMLTIVIIIIALKIVKWQVSSLAWEVSPRVAAPNDESDQ